MHFEYSATLTTPPVRCVLQRAVPTSPSACPRHCANMLWSEGHRTVEEALMKQAPRFHLPQCRRRLPWLLGTLGPGDALRSN